MTANKRRSAVLVLALAAALMIVGGAIGLVVGAPLIGLVAGLLAAAVICAAAYWKGDALTLGTSKARPADPADYARLHNLVEGLCVAAGLPKPALYVIVDDAPNAYATGRNPRHASIAVTTGLLAGLSRVELEGVLAHELSHVKNDDILLSTLGVLLPFAVDRTREGGADVTGVSLTRYPPGLISALQKLRADQSVVQVDSRLTAHLWIEPSVPPTLDERIEALQEL